MSQAGESQATGPARLVIISGPSGAGKSTVVKDVLSDCKLPLLLSVSATTRSPRPGEKNGVDYHFLSKEEFARKREAGEFLEWKEVHGRGDWYGTLRQTVQAGLSAGRWVVLEIDVEGMASVVESFPDAITIFIHSGSIEELERRLRFRGTETDESLRLRLEAARKELECLQRYRFQVINDRREDAVREICRILLSQRGDC